MAVGLGLLANNHKALSWVCSSQPTLTSCGLDSHVPQRQRRQAAAKVGLTPRARKLCALLLLLLLLSVCCCASLVALRCCSFCRCWLFILVL
jgi:hypothetical protein